MTSATQFPVFDPISAPLFGVNLIEAGAGTGKTYTIASLVLRLLLQRDMGIEQILVVTFTEAATAELRGRLYQRIGEALAILQNPELLGDADPLLQTLLKDEVGNALVINRLQQALHGFDEAAVFTIHGFCKRVLEENAFESAVQFDLELIKNEQGLFQEIVNDFWRLSFYTEADLSVQTALKQFIRSRYSSNQLLSLVSKYSNQLFLQLNPAAPAEPDWQALEQQYTQIQQQFKALQALWQVEKTEIEATLSAAIKDKLVNGRSYKLEKLPEYMQALSEFLQTPGMPIPKHFRLFCADDMPLNKNKPVPKHAFFLAAQAYKDAQTDLDAVFEQGLLRWQHQAFAYAQNERERRSRQRGQQSFNDLLNHVYLALQGQGRAVLLERLRQKYHAALIDEFQDTDILQYRIFSDVFKAPAQREDKSRSLFFIGDPKQAIYAFRGADIFTYITAAKQVDQRYTLTTNWRSQAYLLTAINALFAQHAQPFLLDDIQYHALSAAKEGDAGQQAALQLHYLDRQILGYDSHKGLASGTLSPRIPHLLAQEILQQLETDPELSPGDIAVLVPSNRKAAEVQKALQAQGLPVVLYSKQSVFESHEAGEMLMILAAVIEPQNEDGLRAALASDLLGLTALDLEQLSRDTLAWETWLFRFQHYQQIWQQRGFHLMAHQLMQDLNLSVRLLGLTDGERRLTNLLHLIEILHEAQQQGQGMRYLLKWLHERCELAVFEQDSYLLRLESDAQAIKISTIHHSKGLQYPVVFLPYAWQGISKRSGAFEPFTYHQNQEAERVYLQLSKQESAEKAQLEEKAAENLRLFYVAVTRAESRCHLFWGAHQTLYNPIAYLLQLDKAYFKQADSDLIAQLKAAFNLPAVNIQPLQLHRYAAYQRSAVAGEQLNARAFKRYVGLPWQIISFSALLKQQNGHQFDARIQPAGVDALYDSAIGRELNPILPSDADLQAHFNLPASAHMGNFLHEVLQYLDFQTPDYSRLESKLQTYGYETDLQTPVESLLNDVLATALNPESSLRLADLSHRQRLNEVEFFYPLKRLDAKAFNQLLQSYPPAAASGALQFKQLQGFMRGFIDLVFYWQGKYYLLDYKSNRLGFSLADYQTEGLNHAMQQHHYVLQYLIYSVALQQYLQNRLPDYDYEQHFGGIYYLFLRGMQPSLGNQTGVYFDRPPQAFIEQLSQLLTG